MPPAQVEADVLKLVLSYCRYHRAEGRSDKERKLFDEKFIRMDTRRLCELTSAADACAFRPACCCRRNETKAQQIWHELESRNPCFQGIEAGPCAACAMVKSVRGPG